MKDTKTLLVTIVGICVMLAGFLLPAMGPVTEVGMKITFIFLGTLFLWSTVGGPWVCLLAIAWWV